MCLFQIVNEINCNRQPRLTTAGISPPSMKVSPPSPPMSAKEQEDESRHDDMDATGNCLKRRRLHSQTNIIINGHYRHRKHIYPRDEDKSSSMDCFDAISNSVNGNSNSSCNSSNSGEDASDCDDSSMMMMPSSYPNQQHPEGETSSPPPPDHNNKVRSLTYKLVIIICCARTHTPCSFI